MKAYKRDLAYIHDAGFGGFARGAAPGILAMLREGGIPGGLVVDLACGSGIWARALCDAGYQVLGIDISASMIQLARKRAPRARFQTGSFLDAELPPCDAVTALGECFNYLLDERNSLSQLRRLFRRVHRALRPGGLFVFDLAEPGRGSGVSQRHRQGADWAMLVDYEEDRKRKRLTRRITSFRKVGKLFRRDTETHVLRLYKRSETVRELRATGFRVRTLQSYGQQRFPEAYAGFLARKP